MKSSGVPSVATKGLRPNQVNQFARNVTLLLSLTTGLSVFLLIQIIPGSRLKELFARGVDLCRGKRLKIVRIVEQG